MLRILCPSLSWRVPSVAFGAHFLIRIILYIILGLRNFLFFFYNGLGSANQLCLSKVGPVKKERGPW